MTNVKSFVFQQLLERFLDPETPAYDLEIVTKEIKEMLKEFKIIKVEIIPRRPSHDLEDK
jgi:hypothetical protein